VDSLRAFWRGFSRVMEKVGNFQARLLLTVFYLVISAPFGIGVRLFSDRLRLRRPESASAWVPREPRDTSLDNASRQY
jgi:hypothetical protein